jgi:predicted esterase
MRKATVVLALVIAGVGVACAADPEGEPVTVETVSDPTTQEVLVVEPDAEGTWPIVFALHGLDGEAADMAELAGRVAGGGSVVFAPTYRTDVSTEEELQRAVQDIECGYRFARSIAPEHGADPDRPVTFVGWSFGATGVLNMGLLDEIPQDYVGCFGAAPRPDVIVGISGCYFEHDGVPQEFDVSEWGNRDARIVLVAGAEDTTCAAWQSEKAAAELRAAGYQVDLVTLEGANHYAPVFHDVVDGEWVVISDDPPGEEVVDLILEAAGIEDVRT